MKISDLPNLIQGDVFEDNRGKLSFVNDFQLDEVKRFYLIEHPSVKVVRAWQAHKVEKKWFYVTKGSFLFAWVNVDNFNSPSKHLNVNIQTLSSNNSQILHIPGGFANGFKAIEPNSQVIVFSNFSLEQSKNDNYRFDSNLWFNW